MAESTQHKLDRTRPPRVQITYDVEVGDSIETRELPFIMGVMSDLSGDRDPDKPMRALKDRKFTELDRDNFNGVMADISPRLALRVDNKLDGAENSQLSALLNFKNLDDFSPLQVIQQVEPMRKLFEARTRLNDLLAKLDGNDDLEGLLQNILSNADTRAEVKKNIDASKPADDATPAATEDAKPAGGPDAQPKS